MFRVHRRYGVQNCIIELYNVHVKCLEYTEDMMYRKETELTAGLGVAIGLMGIEMVCLV